jgi:hypothetical protein
MIAKIIEISVYMLLVALFIAYRTVLSGQKNGCFYFKGSRQPYPKLIRRAIKNIHFIETPAWYIMSATAFFFAFALQRFGNYTIDILDIAIQVGIALLFMAGTYQMPSYHFQRGITGGTKKAYELDKINESEVAIMLFGKKIQFWKGRLFSNKRRKLAQWLGVLEILAAIALFVWFNIIKIGL